MCCFQISHIKMRSLAGEPISQKCTKDWFFSPSGHKEKLGEGERIVFCQPKSEFCGSFAEMRKIKISQFGPLHFTFRLFSSETNDNSFQRMISELAEQIWLQNHIDAEEKKPVWSVCNGVLERQCDLSTKFFPKVLKAEPPSKKKKRWKHSTLSPHYVNSAKAQTAACVAVYDDLLMLWVVKSITSKSWGQGTIWRYCSRLSAHLRCHCYLVIVTCITGFFPIVCSTADSVCKTNKYSVHITS